MDECKISHRVLKKHKYENRKGKVNENMNDTNSESKITPIESVISCKNLSTDWIEV